MSQKLIIIRGNSGSGKSTIAAKLRAKMPMRTMFLQQDVLRHEVLNLQDKAGNPVIGLIRQMALYGKDCDYDVILEGILRNDKYGDMVRELIGHFKSVHVYYLDVPFEETLNRHRTRPKVGHFGEADMQGWWREKDYLGTDGEKIFDHSMSADEIVDLIVHDIA